MRELITEKTQKKKADFCFGSDEQSLTDFP
jgi:hypothetical protein